MRILRQFAAYAAFTAAAFAGSWEGHLIDVMCKDKDPAKHSRTCAIGCAKSGFGLLTDGKFVKFDEEGNRKVLEALKASNKDDDLKVTVTGELQDGVLKVASVELK